VTDRLRAARALLEQAEALGLGLTDLLAVGEAPAAPTVADYAEAVAATFGPGTARTYRPVGRLAGYPVAQAFAGHAPPSVTGTYLHATIGDVATAIR
jgi:hypothetical protein